MANTSIFAAFERMWHHICMALSNKIDRTEVYTKEEIDNMVGDIATILHSI